MFFLCLPSHVRLSPPYGVDTNIIAHICPTRAFYALKFSFVIGYDVVKKRILNFKHDSTLLDIALKRLTNPSAQQLTVSGFFFCSSHCPWSRISRWGLWWDPWWDLWWDLWWGRCWGLTIVTKLVWLEREAVQYFCRVYSLVLGSGLAKASGSMSDIMLETMLGAKLVKKLAKLLEKELGRLLATWLDIALVQSLGSR